MNKRSINYIDVGIGIFIYVLTICIFIVTSTYPEPHINPVGASTFPRVLSVVMCITATVLVFQALKNGGYEPIKIKNFQKVLSIIALLIAYTLILKKVGFTISTMVLMFCILYLLEMKKYRYLVLIPIIATLVIQYIFQKFLNVPLPDGIITLLNN
ncbi:tripartite tricarboxylate transporter TctB family protein [Petroclostridium sp. X23]|uniref:tripartite tricarboxylate transporter TctB family protein n=1 Tax=Petroclostridium sp. X23 TaxID=3045146 RepID=UPI0024ACB7FE|nr:tripartite tricarboxylate transporter TctB family protein [Petroclostridium sp. X23]WHH58029.1 tripartite tricarboxylate transporter TctB family protein [Petroclostridium sp. X23]